MTIRIVLADGHSVVLAAIRALLDAEKDVQVVEAVSNKRALPSALVAGPDVVVMELLLPRFADGLVTIEALLGRPAPPRVLVLTACATPSLVRQALAVGAMGYVLKRSALPTLLDGLSTVAGGRNYLDPALNDSVAHMLVRHSDGGVPPLSTREETVLYHLALGYTIKEVARQLGLSAKTIETYRARAAEKLMLSNRVALMRYAVQQGWVSTSP